MKTDTLKAIAIASAVRDVRFYLNGLHVSPHHMTATNGHWLARIDHGGAWIDADELPGSGNGPGIIIPPDAIKALPSKADVRLSHHEDETWNLICSNGQTTSFVPVDGTFPDVERIITRLSDCAANRSQLASFNLPLLEAITKCVKLTAKSLHVTSELPLRIHNNGTSAARLTCSALPDLTLVMMPMRDNEADSRDNHWPERKDKQAA
jgi:DNA polymerase III sliding clamp (beta) subunit (PCNA family)